MQTNFTLGDTLMLKLTPTDLNKPLDESFKKMVTQQITDQINKQIKEQLNIHSITYKCDKYPSDEYPSALVQKKQKK